MTYEQFIKLELGDIVFIDDHEAEVTKVAILSRYEQFLEFGIISNFYFESKEVYLTHFNNYLKRNITERFLIHLHPVDCNSNNRVLYRMTLIQTKKDLEEI